jgi:hypothetical protein
LDANQLEKFTGYYWNTSDNYSRKMYVRDDTLRYFRNENSESPLAPIGDNAFQMLDVGADLIVEFNIEGKDKSMEVTIDDNDPITSMFYVPVSYSANDLQEYAGNYYSEELGTPYIIDLKENTLYAEHMRTGRIDFEPIMKDYFTGDKWYFGSIEFVRDNAGNLKGMKVSSGRVKNLWFKKR